jgi:hypothetical protein
MMSRLASDIREADRPIYCSACFNSKDVRHVDFDAACDRGYSDGTATAVAMDDLILCEDCVKEGARLLGMSDERSLYEQIEQLSRKLDISEKATRQAQRYADTMEEALSARPERVHIDHRKKPRKEIPV